MKIKKLALNNFAKFTDFEVEFNDKITRLVGVNGSGKTTIGLTSIWACLKGIAEKSKDGQLLGERFRFIGGKKASADIELTLFDDKKGVEILVTNHITAQSNEIKFSIAEDVKDYTIDENWLKNLLSVAFLSTKNFCSYTPKEQAVLLGIDLSKLDAEMSELKNEFTLLNREYKGYGELVEVKKVEKVSATELMKEKDDVELHNKLCDKLIEKQEALTELKEELKQLQNSIKETEKEIKEIGNVGDKIDTAPITAKINSIDELNKQSNAYEEYISKKSKKDEIAKKGKANKTKQEALAQKRIDTIKSYNFGFEGLSVDDEGKLLLNDRPLQEPYFSKGELEIIIAKLYASMNPDLKVRFIDDFELLDEDNQAKLLKELFDLGFQVITAEVGKESAKDNVLLLRECKKVDNYGTKGKLF